MFREKIEALKKEINAKQAEAKAYAKLAKDEERDLNDDEVAAIDKITDTDLPKLKAELARFEKLAAFSEEENHSRSDQGASGGEQPERQKIVVPAVARRHAPLKAFSGPTAEEDAYASGRWLLATFGKHDESDEWCQQHGIETRQSRGGMVTTDNTLGGYTIPTPMEISIIALREQYGVFRRNARIEPMTGDLKTVSRPIGGMTAEFVGEGESPTESNSKWKAVELVCRKLMALARMSKELNVDSVVSIADQVARDVAHAFALKEDQCGFLGDGTSTYGGITGLINKLAAGSFVTAASGNTAFSTLDLTDFESMVGKLPDYAERNGNVKWYISKAGFAASMMRLMDAAGGNTSQNIGNGPPMKMFLGYPVEIVQVMNNTLTAQTSTSGLVYFGDLSMAATLADRQGMSLETSSEVYFTTDEIALKGTERVGINIHEAGTASEPGPIVGLKTPGA